MSGPDGPEEREADMEERSEYCYDELDREFSRAEEQTEEDLLDQAMHRMNQFFIGKVML